jgi:hypothetical protein
MNAGAALLAAAEGDERVLAASPAFGAASFVVQDNSCWLDGVSLPQVVQLLTRSSPSAAAKSAAAAAAAARSPLGNSPSIASRDFR